MDHYIFIHTRNGEGFHRWLRDWSVGTGKNAGQSYIRFTEDMDKAFKFANSQEGYKIGSKHLNGYTYSLLAVVGEHK